MWKCKKIDFINQNRNLGVNKIMNKDDVVPYPEYPGVTVKDIRTLHGRNMKPMTDKEKAKLIYMLRECDEQENKNTN